MELEIKLNTDAFLRFFYPERYHSHSNLADGTLVD